MSHSRLLYPPIATLCAFEAVARTLSFTMAADELSLTQSAVSRQIRALETQLDCRLFIRNTRHILLSMAGQDYLDEIAPALTQIRNASLDVISKGHQRIATIALLPTFGTRWLMPRIPRFMQMYPDATLNFTTSIGKVDFQKESIDGAIYHGLDNWDDANLTLLMSEEVIPVASPQFIKKHPISCPEDLQLVPKLYMKSRPNEWQDWFEHHGLSQKHNAGMIFEQFSLVTQACMASLGVALMPQFLIAPELEKAHLEKVGNSIKNREAYYFATPNNKPPNSVATDFGNWIHAEAIGQN